MIQDRGTASAKEWLEKETNEHKLSMKNGPSAVPGEVQLSMGFGKNGPSAVPGELQLTAIDDTHPLWSDGSALHASGICKPCAWSWKPRGCAQGARCVFCHLCDENAHKLYRKERLAGLKANRAKRKNKGLGITEEPLLTRFSM